MSQADTSTTPASTATSTPTALPRQGLVLTVLLSAMFMAQFDFFVVNVAAPDLSTQLHAGPAELELIVGGYAFAYASGMITGGRLGDLFGYRRLFLIGMVSFALSSLLCGIAGNPTELVVARLLQGLTGALMVPQVLATITAAFPVGARGRAIGWYGAASGLGSIAGQVLGGLLLELNVFGLGWRVIFLINVPIGAVASVLAARMLPRLAPARKARLDPLGAIGVALSLALVLVPLALGNSEHWPVWTWLCLALAVPVALVTLYWQRTLGARGGHPVLDLSLFRVPTYRAGIAAAFAFMAYFASFMFTLTLLLQGGFGLHAFAAGLAFAPMGVLYTAAALLGFRLVRRLGQRMVPIGGCITGLGLLTVFLRLQLAPGSTNLVLVMVGLGLVGIGNGIVLPQLIGAALSLVKPHQAGIGAAVFTTGQQFASAAGAAVIGSVFFAVGGGLTGLVDYGRAMRVSTLVDLGLVLVLIGLAGYTTRLTARLKSTVD